MRAGRTPYCTIHDIDGNKPSGSFAIRVQTFAYTIERRREELFGTTCSSPVLQRKAV
jgi:predicted nucleotide-binding protein (sugar kinase/HSP70/actin superfamily)